MLEGRSMYIWRLKRCLGTGTPADMIAKAKLHKISSLWPKIADGGTSFDNIKGSTADRLRELVSGCHAENIAVCGYHVPHCATTVSANSEAAFVCSVIRDFGLDGLIIDNEEGASYFQGGAPQAHAYGAAIKLALAAVGKFAAMSSHDVVSAHPNAQANVIGQYINVNAPQVYYGQSASVDARLNRAIDENAHLPAPFVPTGAGFIREPGEDDGGCANPAECAARAARFIELMSGHHAADAARYPGYSFWNWEEAPDEFWEVLRTTPVF